MELNLRYEEPFVRKHKWLCNTFNFQGFKFSYDQREGDRKEIFNEIYTQRAGEMLA